MASVEECATKLKDMSLGLLKKGNCCDCDGCLTTLLKSYEKRLKAERLKAYADTGSYDQMDDLESINETAAAIRMLTSGQSTVCRGPRQTA